MDEKKTSTTFEQFLENLVNPVPERTTCLKQAVISGKYAVNSKRVAENLLNLCFQTEKQDCIID